MALLLIAGPILLPEYRDPTPRRLDFGSAALSLIAVLAVIYGMKMAAQQGIGWSPLAFAGAGVVVGACFVMRQRRLADPLLDLHLFRTPAFSASLAAYLLCTLATFGSYVVVQQYLQLVLGLSPLAAGLWTLPWGASYIVGSFLAPVLARRTQPAYVMGGGLLLAACAFVAFTRVVGYGVEAIVIASTLYSLGMSPVFTLSTDMIIGSAPASRAGAAAALSETGAEMGGALGIAVLGSIGTAIYRAALGRADLAGVSESARNAALDTLGGAVAVAAQHPSDAASVLLLSSARAAYTYSLQATLWICALVSVATALIAVVALRRR
jgi:DHA2 family multidrug resistance protein-like MFS transporter